MQEAKVNLFPFYFQLLWDEEGNLLSIKLKFSFKLKPEIEYLTDKKVLNWVKKFYKALVEYWTFKKNFIDVPHRIQVTKFEKIVLAELRKLKIVEIITYKELAERIEANKAFRAVGRALAKNPLPLVYPCHRIISKKGLGGFSQGLLIKQFLLYRELKYRTFDINDKFLT